MPRLATISGARIWCARQARRLHRHHLAVLVEADEGDQRPEQHRKGQEARHQQAACGGRHSATARHRHCRGRRGSCRFRRAGRGSSGSAPARSAPPGCGSGTAARGRRRCRREGKKLRLIMPSRDLGMRPRISRAIRAAPFSSAPIGWPPGRWARTWYIQTMIAANSSSGTHKARSGLNWPLVAGRFGILVDLVIGDDDQDARRRCRAPTSCAWAGPPAPPRAAAGSASSALRRGGN